VAHGIISVARALQEKPDKVDVKKQLSVLIREARALLEQEDDMASQQGSGQGL
jgi:hypothetical protein